MSRVEDLYLLTLSSREFLGAALTLIIYDIILTLHDEIHYVWSSRWTFARTAFHVNRMLGPIVFSLHLADVFGYQLTDQTCFAIVTTHILGTLIIRGTVAAVLVVRVCAIYNARPWVPTGFCFVYGALVVPGVMFFRNYLTPGHRMVNPAPDMVPGCLFKPIPRSILITVYAFALLFETCLFMMVVYKAWELDRTPLMKKLMNDTMTYYILFMGTSLCILFGFLGPQTMLAVSDSGFINAVASSMCSRLILSGLSFYDQEPGASVSFLSMDILPR